MNLSKRCTRAIGYALLVIVGVIWAAPTLWLLVTSLKMEGRILTLPPRWLPNPATLDNYRQLFSAYPVIKWTVNSLIVSLSATIVTLAIDLFVGYALARMDFRGKGLVLALAISTILFPVHITVVPLYIMLARIGMLNSYIAYILPITVNGFGIFLFRQFFVSIPREIEESAVIDGCSILRVLTRIIVPLAKPALTTAGVFIFMWTWNDFLWPLIVATDEASMTLPVGLAMFMPASQLLGQIPRYGMSMAGALWATLPAVVVFVMLQKYFIQSIATTGLKG